MHDETTHREHPEPEDRGHGRLAGAALRVVDACLHRLQALRDRIEPPAAEDDARHGRGRQAEAAAAPPAAVPPRSLLRRITTVVLAFAIGAGGATFVASRGFKQLIASQQAVIDYQQDEIDAAKRQDAINIGARAKAQNEAGDARKRVREMQQEIEDRDARIDQLDQQVIELSRRLKPVAAPAGVRAGAVPNKTASCVTGTANAPGRVLDCIDKFNRP